MPQKQSQWLPQEPSQSSDWQFENLLDNPVITELTQQQSEKLETSSWTFLIHRREVLNFNRLCHSLSYYPRNRSQIKNNFHEGCSCHLRQGFPGHVDGFPSQTGTKCPASSKLSGCHEAPARPPEGQADSTDANILLRYSMFPRAFPTKGVHSAGPRPGPNLHMKLPSKSPVLRSCTGQVPPISLGPVKPI